MQQEALRFEQQEYDIFESTMEASSAKQTSSRRMFENVDSEERHGDSYGSDGDDES